MPRRWITLPGLFLAAVLYSCGGGSGASSNNNPPNPGDFQLAFTTSSLAVAQGGLIGDQINLTALDGFNSNVILTFPTLPAGVTVSPPSPISIGPNQSASVSFAVSSNAAVGNSTITVTGTSGTITHSISLAFQINAVPSFQLSLSPPSVTLSPNSSMNIQVSLSGTLPAGSDVSVTIPFQLPNLPGVTSSGVAYVSEAQPTATFQVIAAFDAPSATNVPVQVTGISGVTVVNLNLVVSVSNPFPAAGAASRSTFRRTDEDPFSAVYDSMRKQVFVAVPQINEVRVYSSVDAHEIAAIPVPAPNGVDMSADGTQVIVASRTETYCVVDPAALQLESCNPVVFAGSGASGAPEPLNPLTLASGNALFVVTDQEGGGWGLVEWRPSSGFSSDITPSGIGAGLVSFARSADHSTAAIGGQSGIALFSSASDSFVATISYNLGFGSVAVNPNGTRVAALSSGPESSSVITLFDSQFNSLATYTFNSTIVTTGLLFSKDGSKLYVLGEDVIVCLNSQTLAPIGVVPSHADLGFPSDVDETGLIFAPEAMGRGIGFFDASAPSALGTDFPANGSFSPPQGSPANPGTTTFSAGQGLTSGSQFYFDTPPGLPGAVPATILNISAPTSAQVAPPAHAPGTVNAIVANPDGQLTILPDAFSYGPTIVAMTPSAAPASGQTTVTLMGYGLDFPQSEIHVAVGGQPASVTSVFAGVQFSPFPFPMDTIQFTVPVGNPGVADVTVTTPDGDVTAAKSFQYLASVQNFPVTGGLGELAYDQPRQRLYATNYGTNQVNVFDLNTHAYIAAVNVGQAPAGLSITPDGTKLVVANNSSSNISIINLATLSVSATLSLPASSIVQCGAPEPLWVATTNTNLAVIAVSCTVEAAGYFEILNLNSQTFGCDASSACNQVVSLFNSTPSGGIENLSASADGTKIFATFNSSGVQGDLPVVLWDTTADTLTIEHFPTFSEAAANADGTLFLADDAVFTPGMFFRFFLQDLDYLQVGVINPNTVPGEKLHPSGSLAYQPQANNIDVLDVHRGRLLWRIAVPFQMQGVLDEMAVDETGSRLFCLSTSGISIVQLGEVPLSVGTVNPSSAPASGGTAIVIRGSGFQPGLTLQVGAQNVNATVIDTSTVQLTLPPLPAGPSRITLKNPDGTTYGLDGAILIQ
jgi:YVTN family beta-propeller protein